MPREPECWVNKGGNDRLVPLAKFRKKPPSAPTCPIWRPIRPPTSAGREGVSAALSWVEKPVGARITAADERSLLDARHLGLSHAIVNGAQFAYQGRPGKTELSRDLESDRVIRRMNQILLGAEVSLGRLDGGMAE